MGLDQTAYRVKKGFITNPVDFRTENYNNETGESVVLCETEEVQYWRKHPNLQGWMEDLYREKGGEDEFNCVNVQLTWEDLERLEKDIKGESLPETQGFFFGNSMGDEEEREYDLEFVEKALKSIEEGYDVFYTSWW